MNPASDEAGERAAPARSAVVEAAYAFLRGAGSPKDASEIAERALRSESRVPPALVRAVEAMLESDPRFSQPTDGRFALAAWDLGSRPLRETDFVVFDVESNGGRSGRHRIIEIGAVRCSNGRRLAEYTSLVRLGRKLPKFVSDLTGIQEEALHDAPPIERVLQEFRDFSEGAVLVAHNLTADLAFLNHESHWAGMRYFPGGGIDTMELVVELEPGLEKPSLAGALEIFGYSAPAAHRALPDARAAEILFWRLVDLAEERGAKTAEDLASLTFSAGAREGLPKKKAQLARWCSTHLPALPGVYVFRDATGRALYVGKSNSLQRRVRSHFSGSDAFVRKWDGLLDATDYIDHEVTGSDFAALLREIELIHELKPVYNVQLARRPSARFVRLGPPADPVVGCASAVSADGALYAGPFRTAAAASSMATLVRRVFGLPSRRRRFEVESIDNHAAASLFLREGMQKALEHLERVEGAGAEGAKRMVRGLRRVRRFYLPVAGGLSGVRVLVIGHGALPGDVEFHMIDQGAVTARRALAEPSYGQVRSLIAELLGATIEGVPAPDPDSLNLALAWLHQNHGGSSVLVLRPQDSAAAVDSRVWRRVRELTRF